MIISPPFLVDRAADQSDDDWIDACMSGDRPGLGAYALSHKLCWHGGLHLASPFSASRVEQRVRAIADGTVVLLRPPSERPAEPLATAHPQAFGGGWSDNGVVVIRHTTEIGEGPNAAVTFLSISMHLSVIDESVALDKRIYRKDVIGSTGCIVGLGRRIHFEIVCDDANLRRLIGRGAMRWR